MIPSHCRECNHPIRRPNVPIAEAPGTRQHRADGLCKTCYYRGRRDGSIPEPVRDGTGGVEPVRGVRVFDERVATAALESWLRERRRRMARNGVAA